MKAKDTKRMELTDIKEFNLAAIDVGSNASRLLIKTICIDLEGGMSMRRPYSYVSPYAWVWRFSKKALLVIKKKKSL